MSTSSIPVVTIDGPSGSGKGTLSRLLARNLNFHFLDSGSLYRIVALASRQKGIDLEEPDIDILLEMIQSLDIAFRQDPLHNSTHIIINNQDVTNDIRTELCGEDASKVALIPQVRSALLERQRTFLKPPGLIADGRDMGTVVFPEANVKIFLEASLQERAKRRYNELQFKDLNVSLEAVLMIIKQRDERDQKRSISPLVPAADAIIVDTTNRSIQQVFQDVMAIIKTKGLLS